MTQAEHTIPIREADQPGDADHLSSVAEATFVKTFGCLYSAKDLEAFLMEHHSPATYSRLIGDPKYGLWLAMEQSAPVAYAVAGPCGLPAPDLSADAGELKRIYVSADCRSGGLGGRLMERALDWLEARYSDVYLSVFSENEAAQRFYARYGFQKVHEYFFKVGDQSDHEWIMKRMA